MKTVLNFENLKELAIRAHSGTSFSPEKRGEDLRKECYDVLLADIEELKKHSVGQEALQKYEERYEQLFSAWLRAKSNCISTMITGGSNFPVRRAEKANAAERSRYEAFTNWRDKAKKAIIKKTLPEKTYSSEIDRYRRELTSMEANHVKMKEANKRIKEVSKTGEDISQYLIEELGVVPHMVDWTLKFGFGLSNNLANMKRVKDRIAELEKKQEAQEGGNKEIVFNLGTVVLNYEADRLQILFNDRPDEGLRNSLKKSGFKWAPSAGAWQRQLTGNAIWATKRLLSIPDTI